MNEDLQTVSLHLARVLDEIGLNQVAVGRRRDAYLSREHSMTNLHILTEDDLSVYHFGSQTEGSTTPGQKSDLDILICYHMFNAIQDWAEWRADKDNLLMLHEDTEPGYCRLQVLRSDIPVATENLEGDQIVYDNSNRVILKNTFLNPVPPRYIKAQLERNGPAESNISQPGFMDTDRVRAVKCESWPRQAEEFTKRHRQHNWPTQGLLQQAVEQGCFLVPAGHKLSPTENLEWRLSASLAERCLMFSLNIVHIKVYVILKMLVKSFVDRFAGKCISSYHCKTALLYCTEDTESGFWVERNILQCVIRCLAMMLSWVTECFCPHFIISGENLFAGKINVQNRGKLQSILSDMIKTDVRLLFGVRMDGLGVKLLAKLSTEPSVLPVLTSVNTFLLIGKLEHGTLDITHKAMSVFCVHINNTDTKTAIPFVYKHIEILKGSIRQLIKPKRQATEAIIEHLNGFLGSLLASFFLSHKMRVPREAIQLLRAGPISDVSYMLKFASVLYSNGDYRKVETILQSVNNHFSSNMILSICGCYDKQSKEPEAFHIMLGALRGRKARAKLLASCVIFSRQEIDCAPPALRHEFFRSVGVDLQHRHPVLDQWMDLAVVDCLPFLHYLQYMTYRQLGKQDLQKQSLLNLERIIKHDKKLSHLETAWNLLGQCKELEEVPEAAMTCYMTSLEIRPLNNAANWHVAILCYREIQSHLKSL